MFFCIRGRLSGKKKEKYKVILFFSFIIFFGKPHLTGVRNGVLNTDVKDETRKL